MDNPGKPHWEALQDVLAYLRANPHAHIQYTCNIAHHLRDKLVCYVDSDWAGDVDDRRSTSGWIIFLNGGPIAWGTNKQKSPSGSSMEAEYKAAYHLFVEAKSGRQIMCELGVPQLDPTVANADNQACIGATENPVHQGRTKHVDIKYHIIRKAVEDGEIVFQHVPSHENLADGLSKAQTLPLYRYFQSRVIVYDVDDRPAKKTKY